MGLLRRAGRVAGLVLWLILLIPVLALVPAAFVDQGPGSAVRPTVFPFALALLDPFVRLASLNSLVGAFIVTLGSLVLGVGLARVMTGWRFWGRGLLAALTLAPAVIAPLFTALGLRMFFGDRLVVDGPAGPGLAWICWIWAEMTSGVGLVALATASALGRVEPSWIEAARQTGASRFRIWWELIWPPVRPYALRAAGVVFTLSLVEPGAPLMLGLRRTLAFQIVEAAFGLDPMPRAAVLAMEAVGIAMAGRWLLNWWGGRPSALPPGPAVARAEDTRWPRAAAFLVLLTSGVAMAWLPVWTLIVSAFSPSSGTGHLSVSAFLHRLNQAESRQLIFNSIALGLAVVAIDLVAARSLSVWAGRRRSVARLAEWPDAFPPLTIGVGALAFGWLLHLAVDELRIGERPEFLIAGFTTLRDSLDPYQTPGPLLLLAVAAASQSPLMLIAQQVGRWSRGQLTDVAITLGATERQAHRAGLAGWFGVPPGVFLLTLVLAATSLSPALILTPSQENRPVTPGILLLADQTGEARSLAAALATCVIAVNLTAFGLAAKVRSEPLGDWFHGRP
ncbi:ABC transporter permease [Singulisphaera acidiphila]|uniref:ABC-type Fe3+ transport system, permease component n=1 Tax=Singulisphaera acidiphila (strain ATCC BAA-1392 / DSM 18658 / VKM B-2454 / MOB10) TaxID=886293 RepID=L0DR74_SINAD|nr:ABC transporter permease subunit [Singulisphaera acidiphila]AGA30866.1 ABC-type Fe3+ transport system, permease component [Singulisphaera acidiphila DSM 18658]